MKISDILRDYADTLMLRSIADKIDDQSENKSEIAEPVEQPEDKFLPPLQLKMELLKKASGVQSVYDEEPEAEESEAEMMQVLQQLRKNAGLSPVIMAELDDDEPLGA